MSVLDICDYLEAENAKLESLLQETNEELKTLRGDDLTVVSANKVIPHYRLALTRLKNQSTELLSELLQEQVPRYDVLTYDYAA